MAHTPVMLEQAIEYLNVHKKHMYVDATVGGGGHLKEILHRLNGSGKVIGIDRDLSALHSLKDELKGKAELIHANYSELEKVMHNLNIATINGGIIADLGVSSMQIDEGRRGFSFLKDGPLDMRMDTSSKLTAETLVNELPENELADILFKYGDEKKSRKIARQIVTSRPLTSTLQLAEVISKCLQIYKPTNKNFHFRDSSHPATRTFQALRIAVNEEISSLEKFLRSAIKMLAPGARLVVITFHSIEDRIVKQIFKEAATNCLCPPRSPICTCAHESELLIITRKPLVPEKKEILANPRARSAKLRVGEKK